MYLKFKDDFNVMYFYNKESAGDYGIYTKLELSMFHEEQFTEQEFQSDFNLEGHDP